MTAKTDEILDEAYQKLDIVDAADEDKFKKVDEIVEYLQERNARETFESKITGTITERLCELALKAKVPDIYSPLPKEWDWLGDFYIEGIPLNIIISVKSFKTRERLIVSGSGNFLSPTIGFGLFDELKEWTPDRVKMYLFKGFMAIYMPRSLFKIINPAAKRIENINAKPLVRINSQLMDDIENAINKKGKIDPKLL